MNNFRIIISVLLILAVSRFVPHPPNFTSLIALAFYIPVFFGFKFIYIVLFSFIVTDFILGFHALILFTWGSVVLVGLITKIFNQSITYRIFGCIVGAFIFFLVTNFGVWLTGSYGYSLNGLISCYILALPFFGNTLIATTIYSFLIEAVYFIYLKNYIKKVN